MSTKNKRRGIKEKVNLTEFDNEAGQATLTFTALIFLSVTIIQGINAPRVKQAVADIINIQDMAMKAGDKVWRKDAIFLGFKAGEQGIFYQGAHVETMSLKMAARIVGLLLQAKFHTMGCLLCDRAEHDCFYIKVYQPLWPMLNEWDVGLAQLKIPMNEFEYGVAMSMI